MLVQYYNHSHVWSSSARSNVICWYSIIIIHMSGAALHVPMSML